MKQNQSKYISKSPKYLNLVEDIKQILEVEKIWQEKVNNQIKLQISWKIGERLHRKLESQAETSGTAMFIYQQISLDLSLSEKYLSATVRFFRFYPCPQNLSSELTWSHYYHLLSIDNEQIRRFYELHAIAGSWSVRELKEKIQGEEHKKLERANISLPNPTINIPEPEDVIKNTYHFDFLQIQNNYSEKDLEQALISQIGNLLSELGSGFFFVRNQYKITIAGNSHYIDLVFFHASLSSYILVDLKIEKFQDTFVGQMNKYLRYFRENINLPYMRNPIGVIICKTVNYEEVYYALEGLEKKIFIADYKICLSTRDKITTELKKTSFSKMKISARQNQALEKLQNEITFDVNKYKEITRVSRPTAQRDLKQLVKLGILIRKGVGRNVCYSMV